jgi:hypothetical protein
MKNSGNPQTGGRTYIEEAVSYLNHYASLLEILAPRAENPEERKELQTRCTRVRNLAKEMLEKNRPAPALVTWSRGMEQALKYLKPIQQDQSKKGYL